MRRHFPSRLVLAALALTALGLTGCGNGSDESAETTGTVTTFLSDPPTCASPAGAFLHVWVTITRVRAHISSTAEANDGGWVDLVNLENAPRQIDLLSLASTTCLLNQLGQTSGLPPGNYQQIRVHLLANNASGASVTPSNNCSSVNANNCVEHETLGLRPLLLSSQDQTGIKVPPGRIAGGAIQLEAGQAADINIDFDACASVVFQGPNQFRLRPTLHAGEVSLNQQENAISGRAVIEGTTDPVPNAIVLLEQPDPDDATINRVVRSGLTGSDGSFIFCPLPEGDYDVVVAGQTVDPDTMEVTTYHATIVFDVPVGTSLGDVGLVAQSNGTSPATITGQVTSQNGGAAVAVPAAVSPLQEAAPSGGSNVHVTIPSFGASAQPPTLTTAEDAACPVGTACADFELVVPAGNPRIGTFASGSVTFVEPAAPPVPYNVNAHSTACTAGNLTTAAAVEVTAGTESPLAAPLALTGCTAP